MALGEGDAAVNELFFRAPVVFDGAGPYQRNLWIRVGDRTYAVMGGHAKFPLLPRCATRRSRFCSSLALTIVPFPSIISSLMMLSHPQTWLGQPNLVSEAFAIFDIGTASFNSRSVRRTCGYGEIPPPGFDDLGSLFVQILL
jgi:hypothetical protein